MMASRIRLLKSLPIIVDFNEEFSAFHPNTLRDQSLYVSHAIQYILNLYSSEQPASRKILLAGHSMGGIVARHAVTRPNSASVSAIITMSTPHLIPPVTFERGMQELYDEIESHWTAWPTYETSPSARNSHAVPPVLVSICGGTADTQISSDSCALRANQVELSGSSSTHGFHPDDGTFAVLTTGMEGVWTGVDHQAMVWCDQVRRVVATTLLDMSATNHDRIDADPVDLREELSQKARRRLLGQRTFQELQGAATESRRFSKADASELTPGQPTFNHISSSRSVYVVKVPQNATGVQVIGNMRMNGVGRAGGSEVTIHLESAESLLLEESLPLSILRVLPKSSGNSENSGSQVSFPLQGEGVKDDELLTFAEAVIEPANQDRQLVVMLDGPAWGAIALLGDYESRK